MGLVLGGNPGWLYDKAWTDGVDGVTLTGYVADEDVAALYSGALALVFPSLYEGFGFPVIEAMACGKPVVVSNSSSLPEVAGDVGVLLPPDDESAWSQALSKIILDDSWREEQKPKLTAWASQFTWQRTARQTVESYYRALK